MIGSVALEGAPPEEARQLLASLVSAQDQPYVRAQAIADRDAMLQQLLNRGYEAASVQVDATFDDEQRRAELIFVIQPGPQIFRRPCADRRAHRHFCFDDPTGGDARAGPAARPRSTRGESAKARCARTVPANQDYRAPARGRKPGVTSWCRSRSAGHDAGVWRGLRGRHAPAARRSDGGRAVERIEFAPRGFFEIGRRNLWAKTDRPICSHVSASVRGTIRTFRMTPASLGSTNSACSARSASHACSAQPRTCW